MLIKIEESTLQADVFTLTAQISQLASMARGSNANLSLMPISTPP